MAEDNKSQTQYKREPAVRLFAQELSQTTVAVSKDQGEKADRFAPSYSYSPTGARINRVFIVGTLTEIDEIGGDSNFIKGRLVDATGAINIMAGQYQPEVSGVLRRLSDKLPAFVAIVGKPNIHKPKDGGSYTSIRPESVQIVDQKAVEMFAAETAKRTVERISIWDDIMQIQEKKIHQQKNQRRPPYLYKSIKQAGVSICLCSRCGIDW